MYVLFMCVCMYTYIYIHNSMFEHVSLCVCVRARLCYQTYRGLNVWWQGDVFVCSFDG